MHGQGQSGAVALRWRMRVVRWSECIIECSGVNDAPSVVLEAAESSTDKQRTKGNGAGLSGHHDPINDLLTAIRSDSTANYQQLAQALGVSEATVKRHILDLKQRNRLRRVGSKKTGHWEIIEGDA